MKFQKLFQKLSTNILTTLTKNSIDIFCCFFTNVSKIRGYTPPPKMPLTVNRKLHLISKSNKIRSFSMYKGRAKYCEIFYLSPQSCRLCVVHSFVWHIACDTFQHAYFFLNILIFLYAVEFLLVLCIKDIDFRS